MIKTLNILFYLRKDKADINQLVPIYCRITVDGERAIFAIKRSISLNRWDSSKGRVKGSTEESKVNENVPSKQEYFYSHKF